MKLIKLVPTLTILTLLTACGGGGGSIPGTPPQTPPSTPDVPTNPAPDMQDGEFASWVSDARVNDDRTNYFAFVYSWNTPLDGQIGTEGSMQFVCPQNNTISLQVGLDKQSTSGIITYTTSSLIEQEIFGEVNATYHDWGVSAFINTEDAAVMSRQLFQADNAFTATMTVDGVEVYGFNAEGFKEAFTAGCSWHPDFDYFTQG